MFDTIFFWLAVALFAALARAIPATSIRAKSALLAVSSLVLAWHVVGLFLWVLTLLVGAVAWLLIGIRATQRWHKTAPITAALAVVLPLLFLWVLGKFGAANVAPHFRLLAFVGFSFFLIKAWTLVRDAQDGRIPNLDPYVALAYFLFFPTYVAGPMHLYGEFATTLADPVRVDFAVALDIAYRIALGLVKVKVLVPLLAPITLTAFTAAPFHSRAVWLIACVAYYVMLWADFSGYSDLAIATSAIIGIKTPENFRAPFLADNIRDFWQRWHITFSRVLTSYLFVPISRRLDRRIDKRLVMIIATLGTFLFCGYWHGATLNFIAWGAYHGVGLIVFDFYRDFAMQRRRKQKNKTPPTAFGAWLGRTTGIAFTFVFVSIGWTFFVLPLARIFGGH